MTRVRKEIEMRSAWNRRLTWTYRIGFLAAFLLAAGAGHKWG
jgi:hypothetical protein